MKKYLLGALVIFGFLFSFNNAFAANDGDGLMTVSPSTAVAATSGNTFTFSFVNNGTTFQSNSKIRLTIPAGWTAPQISNSANPGFIVITDVGGSGCNPGAATIAGSGPWTIDVPQTCTNGSTMTIAYGAGSSVSKVTTPSAGTYTFTTLSQNGNSGLTNISSTQPKVTVTATYTITTASGAGGTLSPSSPSVAHGSNQTFTIQPSAGNIVADVSVDSVSQGRINSYKFSNVTAAHSISATFESGWSAPSSSTNNNSVTNPNNAFSSNDSYAVFNDQNDRVDYTTFGLSIPSGATINGIELAFEANRPDPRTVNFSLSTDGTTWTTGSGAKNSGSVSSTDATYILGGTSDLWNRTWTPADFSNLRVRVDAQTTGPGDILNLDQLQVKVSYSSDTTPPPDPIIDTNPTNPSNSTAFAFTFHDTEAGVTFECKLDSDPYSACNGGSFSGSTIEGSRTFYVKAKDALGNESSTVSFSWVIDTTAPVISLNGTTPVDVQLNGTYSDAGATASDDIDGDITGSIVTTVTPGGSVDTSALGTFTVHYNVSDAAGNTATEVTRTVNIVDQESPSTTDNTPAAWQNTDTTISLSCTDNVVCTKVYYTTDGTDPTLASNFVDSGSSWQFTVSAEGQFTIKYFGVDTSDNAETIKTASNTLKIDKTAPTVSITAPTTGDYLLATEDITADAVDTGGSDLAKVEFWDGAVSLGEDTSAPYSFSWDTTGVADGNHVLKVVAFDNAGNQTTSADVSVTVDNTNPVITLLGENPKKFFSNDPYVEDGATALDAVDGDLTANIVIDATAVEMGSYGSYTVTYTVSDTAGNTATETRTVDVGSGGGGIDNQAQNNGGGEVLGEQTENTENENDGNNNQESNTENEVKQETPESTPEPQPTGEVLGASKFIFTEYMKLGSKWGEVSELQKRLIAEGFYKGAIDGKFGKILQQAVKDYQKANPPLKVDGIVGPKTRAVLNK